ncbi:unnamed protein product [Lepeophtheirus salmonis]|uniref:(salmon louse) hypothetical protein n=1 Tax=Lepeophtheirus salmonis TaxID=72036 RepID=A0A7R8CE67_LEPSM|nr:unnamed protein product [Lepeophtheirus salmonis]CAF2755034.1 unnamed protein product [Lepeophtheirus salmonis]
MPNKKLASIFVRESPEVTAARKAFLHSQAPERIKKLRDKELSAETIGHDYFNDFSNVLHVNYSSTQYSSDQINIPLRNEDVNVNQILSKDSNLSWLLSRNEEKIEEMTIDDSSGFKSLSLPLDNKHIFLFAHLESTSTRQCFIDLMKRDTSDIDKFPWTLKYAPQRCSHILGNQHTIFSLKVWLKSFSSKIKYSPVYSDTESCSSLSEFGANAAILYGPHGCGKTSTVYALASEFGFNVLEVNASSSRSGRQLTNQTHEATQSHRVEDIDLFFEDGDEGFYQALSGTNIKKSIPLPKVDQLHAYKLSYPPLQVTSRYLCSIALKEGYPVSSRSITEILQKFNGNISKSILELQFLCLSSKQTQSSDHSPILYEMDTSLSEVMNIPMNFQTTDVQTRLHCIIPFKKDNTTSPLCCRSLNYSITDASFSESMEAHNKPRTYSKKDIKEMEYIATRLDIHSGFCEKENKLLEVRSSRDIKSLKIASVTEKKVSGMNKKDSSEGKMAEAIERPKMPRATWDALRAHIQRERARKKQEIEETQEFERQKKERERKKKQEKLSLEDTKEQIAQLEARLAKFRKRSTNSSIRLRKFFWKISPEGASQSHTHLMCTCSPLSPASQITPSATAIATPSLAPPAKRQRSPSPTSRNSLQQHSAPYPPSRNPTQGTSSYHSSLGRSNSSSGYPSSNPNFTHANSSSGSSPAVNVTGSAGLVAAVAAAAAHYPYTASAARSVAMAAVVSAEEERSKQIYAAAAAASQNARTYDRERAALVAAAAQRLPLGNPPAAHGPNATTLSQQVYRGGGGSIMSGYPRFSTASTSSGIMVHCKGMFDTKNKPMKHEFLRYLDDLMDLFSLDIASDYD